ncbi:hypothetical protein BDW62DRAFT_204488 [Aspergillus aurantiobrunneus]
MSQYLVPFLPPFVLFGAVHFFEQCSSSGLRRFLAWTVVTAVSLRAIFVPSSYDNPLANYVIGFFSCWYIIWSANVLLVKDLTTLQRIRRQRQSSPPVHVWQSLPSSHSWERVFWALDLTFNFRAVGWNFSNRQSHHPPVTQTHLQAKADPSETASGPRDLEFSQLLFLGRLVRRLLVSTTWFVGYPYLARGAVTPMPAVIKDAWNWAGEQGLDSLADLLAVATTLYMFMDGIHAVLSLVGVVVLGSEQWRYPPFFGPVEYLISGRLQDLWGKFWHDLLKEGLLSTAKGALPWKRPKAPWAVLRIWACFVLTGAVHASASYVVSREPQPSLYAGVFYCLQPVGILIQMSIAAALRTLLPRSTVSRVLLKVIAFAVCLGWLYYCFPWVSSDPGLRQAIGAISPVI